MSKLHIKKGDQVVVLSGVDKGKTGRVLEVLVDKQRAIVEGVAIVAKHAKPSAKNPQGGIEKKEAPIHIAKLNLCLLYTSPSPRDYATSRMPSSA